MPIIESLIQNGSGYEMVLELIQNANDLIDSKLSQASISKIYKLKLSQYSSNCKVRIAEESLSLVKQYISSKVQFVQSNFSDDYLQKVKKNLDIYFDQRNILQKISIEFLLRGWTFNFEESGSNVFSKLKDLL